MAGIPEDAVRETWPGVYDKTLKLAAMIESHCRQTGESFDAIVVVPRGSYYPVNIIARQFGFTATDLLHACVSTYKPGTSERQAVRTGQMPADDQVAGKNLLIIEEICDTGQTMKFLIDRFKGQGAALVRVGALHYKAGGGFKPDWYAAETDKWVVYPWEEHEAPGGSIVKKRT